MELTFVIAASSIGLAKEIFGESFFLRMMSATGDVPGLGYVTSGEISQQEYNRLNGNPLIKVQSWAGPYSGVEADIARETGWKLINDVPEGYVNPDKPWRVESWAAKQVMAATVPGLCSSVEAYMDAITDVGQKESAKASWYNAKYFERNNPLIAAIQIQASMTDAQIDAMFQAAWELVPVW